MKCIETITDSVIGMNVMKMLYFALVYEYRWSQHSLASHVVMTHRELYLITRNKQFFKYL